MPVYSNFKISRMDDSVLNINVQPPQNITNWSVQFQVGAHFCWYSGLITKSIASGISNGSSGISIVNNELSQFQITINSSDTSGLVDGIYACQFNRIDSGYFTRLYEGFLLLYE